MGKKLIEELDDVGVKLDQIMKVKEDAKKKAQGVQKAKIHKPDIKPTIRTKASK